MQASTGNLQEEQKKTLASPRFSYGLLAKTLFVTMDLFYGKPATLSKFKVLEVIARVPYQSWEHVAYIAMTHTYTKPGFARRVFEFVKESRDQQDNEHWHLLILEEMVQKRNIQENSSPSRHRTAGTRRRGRDEGRYRRNYRAPWKAQLRNRPCRLGWLDELRAHARGRSLATMTA